MAHKFKTGDFVKTSYPQDTGHYPRITRVTRSIYPGETYTYTVSMFGNNLYTTAHLRRTRRPKGWTDPQAVSLGKRSDGYTFFLVRGTKGQLGIRAGCRKFESFAAAREHWLTKRDGTPLGNESQEFIRAASRLAQEKGWTPLPATPRGRRRLGVLVKLLRANASNRKGLRFDMRNWGRVYGDNAPAVACNTTGCAWGLGLISGRFHKAGARVSPMGVAITGTHTNIAVMRTAIEQCPNMGPTIASAMLVFDLSYDQTCYLFTDFGGCPDGGVGAKAERWVARRIARFAAGKEGPLGNENWQA